MRGYTPAAFNTFSRAGEVLGILSLVFWSLILVVSIKYAGFIMRADNKGEGGSLALLADAKLRGKLSARWTERMSVWFGDSRDPRLVVARLVADGAWIDRCLGLFALEESERAATAALVVSLIDQGAES